MQNLPRLIASLGNHSAKASPTSSRVTLGAGTNSAPTLTGGRGAKPVREGATLAVALWTNGYHVGHAPLVVALQL
jgi:hypothetical protein